MARICWAAVASWELPAPTFAATYLIARIPGLPQEKDLMLSSIAAEEKRVYNVRSGLRPLLFPNAHRYQVAFSRCQRSPRSQLLSKLLSLIWFARLTSPRPTARLAQSLIASGFGPLTSQAFSIALVPVLFRLYEPSDFGVWAAIQAVAIMVGSLLSFRFDLALVIERDSLAASRLFLATIGLVCVMSLVLGAVTAIFMRSIQQLGIGPMPVALGWGWLSLVGLAVVLQAWLMREGAFARISTGVVLNAITANLVQLGGGFSGDGVWLVVGSVVGQGAATLFYVCSIQRSTKRPAYSMDVSGMMTALMRNRRFPQFSLPFTVLSLLRERAPIFIIGAFSTASLVGVYSQAWRLTHLPSAFTSASLRPVFFHRAATEGLAPQGDAVDRIMRWLLIVSSPWIALLVFGGDELFMFVLGSRWQGAGWFSAMLVVPASLFMMTNWMDRLLDSIGRQDLNLRLEAVAAISSVGSLLAMLASGRSLTEAVALQSVMLTLSYLAFLWICYGAAGWSRSVLLRSIAISGVLGAVVYVMLSILRQLLAPVAVIALGAMLGGAITAIALLRARRDLL
ncbi:oligosaccharide flippase family protein [Bradyrhizobium sp. BWC-3-1]|uniref:oligosaccharide flippase family protein n=1 Tax=Bradyrhizobium sp. BWC-3-1 TaxID=3080012 RepID=UPI00293E9A32|nr:oligosaccharide flippase family protein [Bradyrhizobium sp. BWC-3-1]WOH61252.1 oligosaccharide flippase family protein [Bradyrhizobium sp. BWC-3-1]